MSSRRKNNERRGAFDGMSEPSDLQETADEIFHPGDDEMARASELSTGRISAKPLPIVDIRADITQPRRIVPKEIRGVFDGYGQNVPALLDAWHDAVLDEIDELPVSEILNGRASAFDYAVGSPVVVEFVKLLDLAAQIHDTGLQQPIGAAKLPRNKFEIIFGERRWFAFHVLTHFGIDGYQNIPAKVASSDNAFEIAKIQSSENRQRDELNAVQLARQFAKLVMRARQDTQNPPYDHWAALVVPGGCDLPYYAQVSNGDLHPIPRGMGPIFAQALRMSGVQMRQHRALLRLTDDHETNNLIWDMADEGNWSENLMRDIRELLDIDAIRTILKEAPDPKEMFHEAVAAAKAAKPKGRSVTGVTLHDEDEAKEALTPDPSPEGRGEQDKSGWASAYWAQRWAYASSALVWVIEAVEPNIVKIVPGDGNVIDEEAVPVPVHVSVMHERDWIEALFEVDDRVHVAGHGAGTIRYIKDGKYGVFLDSSQSTHYYPATALSKLDEPLPLTSSPLASARSSNDYREGELDVVPENWIGKAVKSGLGDDVGLVTTDDGDYVRVKWAGGYYNNHKKDALSVVSYQLWIEKTNPKPQRPDLTSDWTDLYVQNVAGGVGHVVEDEGVEVVLEAPDGGLATVNKKYLSQVDKAEWDAAVERYLTTPIHADMQKHVPTNPTPNPSPAGGEGNKTGLEKMTYPAQGHGLTTVQLVGKPVLYNGQPAVVVGASGSENVVIQIGKGRETVHKDVLVLNNGVMGQRVVDVMTSPPSPLSNPPVRSSQGYGEGEQNTGNIVPPDMLRDTPLHVPTEQTLIVEHSQDYELMMAIHLCAQELGNDEATEAFEQLIETAVDVNPQQLGLLLDECFAHTKEVMAAMVMRLGERFDAILKDASHGAD